MTKISVFLPNPPKNSELMNLHENKQVFISQDVLQPVSCYCNPQIHDNMKHVCCYSKIFVKYVYTFDLEC